MFGWARFVSNPLLPTLFISFQTITSWLCMLEEIIIYKYITYEFSTQTIQTNYKRRKSWFSPKRKTKGDLQCDQKCKNCDWKIIEFSDSWFMICNKSRSFFFKWLEGPRSNNDLAIIKINNDELLRGPEVTFRSLIFPMQIVCFVNLNNFKHTCVLLKSLHAMIYNRGCLAMTLDDRNRAIWLLHGIRLSSFK